MGLLSALESCAGLGEHLDEVDVLINNAGEFVRGNGRAARHRDHVRDRPGQPDRAHAPQGSIISDLEFPGTDVFAATKTGVSSFTQSLRHELTDMNVTTLEISTGG